MLCDIQDTRLSYLIMYPKLKIFKSMQSEYWSLWLLFKQYFDSEADGDREFLGSETIVTQLCKRAKRYWRSKKDVSEEQRKHSAGVSRNTAWPIIANFRKAGMMLIA